MSQTRTPSSHKADTATKKERSVKQTIARRKAIRSRLKNHARCEEEIGLANGYQAAHAQKIAAFHTLEKQLARANACEHAAIVAQQQELGGLESYQEASKTGARHGETSKWLIGKLQEIRGRGMLSLLDVGAIGGTSYNLRWIRPTYIDLLPQAAHVLQADFLEYPVPDDLFDVVSLSLVLNFLGDIHKRCTTIPALHLFGRDVLTLPSQLQCFGVHTFSLSLKVTYTLCCLVHVCKSKSCLFKLIATNHTVAVLDTWTMNVLKAFCNPLAGNRSFTTIPLLSHTGCCSRIDQTIQNGLGR